ncbi:hypothetical protein HZA85_03890 [Candidatus Uhrbacteria bacterium]|nr:hypothetical protein [Candidatus Uhrbacteria bacterium]
MRVMLVLDFDGNLTDVEQEAGPFTTGYLADLATLLDKPVDAVQSLADQAYRDIAGDPATHGWRFGGKLMAPATVDPYLRMTAIASQLLGQTGNFPDGFIDRLGSLLFRHHYRNTKDVLKPSTLWMLLEAYRLKMNVWVVTNSGTSAVQGKIGRALDAGSPEDCPIVNWWTPRVIGDARKFDPSDNPEAGVKWPYKDSYFRFRGFPRDTVIKRPHYFKVLDSLRHQLGESTHEFLDWAQVMVVGDIFELDLALPLWLGCHVGLMVNEHTPPWEVDLLTSNPNGRILRAPEEIPAFYASIGCRAP